MSNKTYFMLELISFLAWLTITKKIIWYLLVHIVDEGFYVLDEYIMFACANEYCIF